MCQLVHRRFQREAPARLAWRAHEGGRSDVEPYDAVLRLDVRTGIDVARLQRRRLYEHVEARGGGSAFVSQRRELAVLLRSERHRLHRLWPSADHAEHLLPREHQLDRTPDLLRCQRGDDHVRPGRPLAPERAAHELRHDVHVLFRNRERVGNLVAYREHPLRRVIERHAIGRVPEGDGRVRLHRAVRLGRHFVRLLDARVRLAHSPGGIAVRGIGLLLASPGDDVVGKSPIEGVLYPDRRRFRLRAHAHEQGGVSGALQRIGHRDGHRLIAEKDPIVLERLHHAVGRFAVQLARQTNCVARRDDRQHARLALGRTGIDLDEAPPRHAARDQDRVGRAGHLHLVRITRLPGHLRAAVYPHQGLSDALHAPSAERVSARIMVRFASSTLKALSRRGRASRNATSAARRNVSARGVAPTSMRYASRERHGLVPTPPSAMRATRILPFATSSAVPQEASAKAYEMRSRTFT